MSEINQADFNVFKAKAISRGKLLERFRNYLQEIVDHVANEGDRVYFGSTNHFDYLKEVADEMDMWKWDRIIKERPEIDPYDALRALRVRYEALLEALQECEEYFDDRADADSDQDGPIPNEEMTLLCKVRDALNAVEGYVLVPKGLTVTQITKLSRAWDYTPEEVKETYAAMIAVIGEGGKAEMGKPVICIGKPTIDRLLVGETVEIDAVVMIPATPEDAAV